MICVEANIHWRNACEVGGTLQYRVYFNFSESSLLARPNYTGIWECRDAEINTPPCGQMR